MGKVLIFIATSALLSFSAKAGSLAVSLNLLDGQSTLNTGQCVGSPFWLDSMNAGLVAPISTSKGTTVSFGGMGSGSFYSDSACTISVKSVVMAANSDVYPLYFKDSQPESLVLTASATGLTSASRAVTISGALVNNILLFLGTGTTSGDVTAVEAQLNVLGYGFDTATTAEINGMSLTKLSSYHLIIVPGGNSITIGDDLSDATLTNVHNVIVNNGVSYLGICAGAYMGESTTSYRVFDLASTGFNPYAANVEETVTLSVKTSTGSVAMPVVYDDGPVPAGLNYVVAYYPNGRNAVVEGKVGSGYVYLSGVHPEGPSSWGIAGYTSTDAVNANVFARALINAGLTKTYLPHF